MTVIVNLLSVTDEPVRFDFRIDPNEMDLDTEGVRIIGDIDVAGQLGRNSAKTDVKGAIKTTVEIDCARCLTPVMRQLDIAFQVDYVGSELFSESKEAHLEGADLNTDIIEDNELDLKEVAREQILLNLPEHLLCGENCKGLCLTCGNDLNKDICRCITDDIDPRWAALKDLKS